MDDGSLQQSWDASQTLFKIVANPQTSSNAELYDGVLSDGVPQPSETTILMNKKLSLTKAAAEESSQQAENAEAPKDKEDDKKEEKEEQTEEKAAETSNEADAKEKKREEREKKRLERREERKEEKKEEKEDPPLSKEDEETEKHMILAELEELKEKHGVTLSRKFTTNDKLSDLQFEVKRQILKLEKNKGVRFMKQGLSLGASALVAVNDQLGPILQLDGWAGEFSKELDNFDEPLGALYQKYWSRRGASMSPEMQLGFGIVSSLTMHHFKSKLNTSGGLGSWMGAVGGARARPQQSQRAPPSRPPPAAPTTRQAPEAPPPSAVANAPSVLRSKRPAIKFPASATKPAPSDGSLL